MCGACAECLLLVHSSIAGRFVSGLTLRFLHCVSCTVISGCVLSGHRAQLKEDLVLGCFSSDGDAAFQGWVVASATTVTYVPHPLQLIPWELPDPVPVGVTGGDGVPSDRAGEEERLSGRHQVRS